MSKFKSIIVALLLSIAAPSHARDTAQAPAIPISGPVKELHFLNEIMASKAGDSRLYVLLGSGFLRATTAGDLKAFVPKWITEHPSATFRPVSRILFTNTISRKQGEIVYIWVEEGSANLNEALVRNGYVIAGTMYDMVDNQRGLDNLLKNPKMADAREIIAKQRADAPQDRTDRLVTDADYTAELQRINAAEQRARTEKLGIWSDAMKDEREADGIR